jgi:hypothetical protein
MKDSTMSSSLIRKFALAVAAATLVLLTGCAQVKLAEPSASIDNIQLAKSSGLAPVAVGAFVPAAGLPKSVDQSVSIRSNTFFSPYDSSFSKYLQQTLNVELKGAGLLESTSKTVIGGQLTKSTVEAGASQGAASLGARFNVSRDGNTVYEKELVENDNWPSSFVGAVAIPDAVNHYTALYRRLVARLFKDEAFRAAVKP